MSGPEAQPAHVALAAGGTAGHVEPALALADALCRLAPRTEVLFIGADRGLEGTLVPQRGYRLARLPAVPMPRRPSTDLLALAPRLHRARRRARLELQAFGADAVVGFGGYAALPPYLAARSLRLPLVVHEANAKAGLANRIGARFAQQVYATHEGVLRGARHLGLPLRPAVAHLDRVARRAEGRAWFGLDPERPVLLVFGGSQGAQHINGVLQASLDGLLQSGISILHAFGRANQVPEARPGYVPVAYIDRMDLAYAAADFAICRAGAMTCAELSAVGLPAAYVPLAIGNGEQELNALPVVNAGGGVLVHNRDLTSQWLVRTIPDILRDPERLGRMSQAVAQFGEPDADEQLARSVLEVAAGYRAAHGNGMGDDMGDGWGQATGTATTTGSAHSQPDEGGN